jgi:hypothetical protein
VRLVQLLDRELRRRVAAVDGDELRLLKSFDSVYRAALNAIDTGTPLTDVISADLSDDAIEYESVWRGDSEWTILPAWDHPDERARCLVSGTGLTHRKGAQNRDSMHTGVQTVTDSMRMYQAGVEGGRPPAGSIGAQPEWFYKGVGTILRGHGERLEVPDFAGDGGDEPELAGCYLIDWSGTPRRLGLAMGNEFSDHVLERQNYLYLAPSKLRTCSIGPELVLDPEFDDVRGTATVERDGAAIWTRELATGEAHMCHSLENLEHHHFKYGQHRQPGDVHIHFFGAGVFSFGDGVALQDGDVMTVAFEGFGRALRNPVLIARGTPQLISVARL